MYMQIAEQYKCSECGSTKNPEYVRREFQNYLRCVDCGHTKLLYTISTINTDKPHYYTVKRIFNTY